MTGHLDEFLEAWQRHLVPLRRQFGFDVKQAWALKEDSALLWLISYDGDDWDGAYEAFRTSPERAALDPDPARLIESVAAWTAVPHPDGTAGGAPSP